MVEISSRLKERLEELQNFEDAMANASMTDEERDRYDILLEAYREEMNVMSFYTRKGYTQGFEEGFAEGYAEGFAEGREEAMLDVARTMINQGLDIELISSITGLSAEIISSL